MSENTFYAGWEGLLRVAVVAVLAYAALVIVLRGSGKRTLSKLNAFDLVVTVALGSTLATIILAKEVALAEGVLAFTMLIGLQFVITWLSVRSRRVSHLVKSEPTLLLHNGQLLYGALTRERVTEAEVRAAVRSAGFASLGEVAAVVLETDGSLTAVPRTERLPSALTEMLSADGAARDADRAGDQHTMHARVRSRR
jgi:uncharacterized membrane protein YcaP (DUF421 family)